MGNGWRALRRRILTPNVVETTLDKRGFHKKSPAAQELLEKVGRIFLEGYGYAVEARTTADAMERLDQIPERFRGFAYEGAGMGWAMLDGLPLPGTGRTQESLVSGGDPHNYLIYVGVGWAMARLPKFRWPDPEAFDPLLRWLVLDGYGFHQAYFRTQKYIHEQYQDERFAWPVASPYTNRAIDQGIGRALWFIGGTDARLVTSMVRDFPEERRSDLYGGIGLAATYAGGADPDELRYLRDHAGEHRGLLAQGSAFAAEARVRAGLLVPHSEAAAEILCGTDAVTAAKVTQDVRPAKPVDGEVPAFETWRQQIANEFVSLGGVHL
ncbi:DUF1702 family protein [Amycolatopsis magusensis]|uniref:DUF1702 family protein n=1 Tax=Amycolatopsis magusensis TaxID=882444 RepID=UPI0024A93C4A|nr:DUF1702 family protein [Amycolatopsis magusensis]MDI5980863.1 DUF1702 family protein [Amycolatopsis magusensis]